MNSFTSETQVIKTPCLLCSYGCGMNVYLEGGRITKVEGMSGHPLNEGFLCLKGEAAVEYFYSPQRLKYPLKRDGEEWKRISWDEALNTIASELKEVKEKEGASSVAVAIGMSILLAGASTVGLIRRFCYAFGSPNCFSVESMCYRSRIISYMLTFGRFCVADPENSNCIVIWGHNPHNSGLPLTQRILRGK